MSDYKTEFDRAGALSVIDQDGKKLVILRATMISAPIKGIGPDTILVAYEGHGAYFWDTTTPMNVFLLIQNGFDGNVSATLSRLLTSLVTDQRPQLKGPR